MNPEIGSASRRRSHLAAALSTLSSFGFCLALYTAWVPVAQAEPAVPYTIIVDRLQSPIDSGDGVAFHAGQYVRYRVRAYDQSGNLTECNPANSNQPQVLAHNPKTGSVVDRVWGGYVGGDSVVNVIMGQAQGAASFEVSCNSAVKRVLLSNDGEPLPPTQQAKNAALIQQAQNAKPLISSPSFAGTPPAPAAQTAPDQTPPPEDQSASGGHALLIAGIVAAGVLGAVAIAAVASGSSSSSGSTCSSGSHQCAPPNSSICCPDGTTIYCTNNNTCTNQTLNNFGDICGNGNNSTADGC